jgi:N-acetylneuraminic acid mutarotase
MVQTTAVDGMRRRSLFIPSRLAVLALGAGLAGCGATPSPLGTWDSTLPESPSMIRQSVSPIAFWTGTQMLVWGGAAIEVVATPQWPDGALYDPVARRWSPITAENAPATRDQYVGAWTGSRWLVWGGRNCGGEPFALCGDGGRYDPATDTWGAPLSQTNAPSPRYLAMSAWTGRELLVWGGQGEGQQFLGDGARYDPAEDRWTRMASAGAPSPRRYAATVWTGSEWVLWGGDEYNHGERVFADGARYHPLTNTWRSVTSRGAPDGRYTAHTVWTGTDMIVWGGLGCGAGGVRTQDPRLCQDGGRYDPRRDVWRPLSSEGAPSARNGAAVVWTGSVMVVWGGTSQTCSPHAACDDGAAYDPVADRWTPLARENAPSARTSAAFVWTGTQMLLWSGSNGEREIGGTASWTP